MFVYFVLFSIVLNTIDADTYNINVDTTNIVYTVPPEYISYDLDMCIIYCTDNYWGLNFTFIEPLAIAIGPAYLRFGGTSTEWLAFRNTTTYNNSVINPSEIDVIYDFSKNVGWRFIFDFNALVRSGGDWASSSWNSTDALEFITYTNSKGYVMDFELGNEPEQYPQNETLTGKQIAQDYHDLRMLLNSNPLYKNSKIVGPALSSVGVWDKSNAIITDFFANGGGAYLDHFTYHHYYMGNANYSQWIDPKVMDTLIPLLTDALNLSTSLNVPSMWQGETGSTWNNDPGGDKFIAGFWWLDKLGLSALYHTDVIVRFEFFGGTWTLVSDPPWMKPTPDYWLTFFYKKLVGQKIYNVTFTPANPYLRIYAASSFANDGSFVLYGMTLTNDSYTLDFPTISNKQVTLYLIKESSPGDLMSQNTLNGVFLQWNTHEFWPNLFGNISSLPLTLPGFSQFFLIVNQTIAQSKNFGCNSFYTGLIRWSGNSTSWWWVNSDTATYKNWKSGYPVGSASNFCSIFDAQSGLWMDTDCDMSYCYVCQTYV